MKGASIAVLGAGIQGSCVALELARRGVRVDLYERDPQAVAKASLHNEGKIHLGFVYANDRSGRTVDVMLRGAISFESHLRRWIDASPTSVRRSSPFLYLVHARSGMDEATLSAHFDHVARRFDETRESTGQSYFGVRECRVRRWSAARRARHFDSDHVVAAYETPEISVHTGDVAERLRSALAAQDLVTLHCESEVGRVSRNGDESLGVHVADPGGRYTRSYEQVVNACWEGRLALDETMDVRPEGRWSFRYKLGVFVGRVQGLEEVPSCTLVWGPFGDVVNFGGGDLYLSWYPECMLGMVDGVTLPRWSEEIAEEARSRAVRGTVEALAGICPDLFVLGEPGRHRLTPRGGVIFARGATDIDDPQSELHERHRIGVRSFGRYHSIDTGKYTTAPLFAMEASDVLVGGS